MYDDYVCPDPIRVIKAKIVFEDKMKMNEWLDSKQHKPPFNKPVWGLFKGRDIEIVQTALTEIEYEDYFKYAESSWYSLESEKCGSVTYWQELKRPKRPQ